MSNLTRKFLKVRPYFYNNFIERHGALTKDRVFLLAETCYEKHSAPQSYENNDYKYSSATYFEVFLAGLYQNCVASVDIEKNVFAHFLREGIIRGQIDRNLLPLLEDPKRFLTQVSRRYDDATNIIDGLLDRIDPIRIIDLHEAGMFTFETVDGKLLKCQKIDGHHRFFWFELCGVDAIQYVIRNSQ